MRSTLVAKRLYAHTAGIAANRPIAVAISASEMPGATIAMVDVLQSARPWNAPMMPHTVPNRPTYGTDRADVGEESRLRSSRSDLARDGDAHGALARLRAALRESYAAALAHGGRIRESPPRRSLRCLPVSLAPRLLTSRNSCARSPPDQKRSSKRSAALASAPSISVFLRKMITHDGEREHQQDQQHQLTGTLASTIRREDIQSAVHGLQLLRQGFGLTTCGRCRRRPGSRATTARVNAQTVPADRAVSAPGAVPRCPHRPRAHRDDRCIGAERCLVEQDTGCAALHQRTVMTVRPAGATQEIQAHVAHQEARCRARRCSACLVDAERTQPLAARAFQEAQVAAHGRRRRRRRCLPSTRGPARQNGLESVRVSRSDCHESRLRPRLAGRTGRPATTLRGGGAEAEVAVALRAWRCGRAACAAGSPAGSGTARSRPRSCRAPRRSPRRALSTPTGPPSKFSMTVRRAACGPSRRSPAGRRRASPARRRRPAR